MHNFKELKVWQEAMELAKEVYLTTATFPAGEKFGLVSQINRSVVSIPSNIAEGAGRSSNKELSQFLSISIGSAFELETQLLLARNLNFLPKEKSDYLIQKVSKIQRMLSVLKKRIIEKSS
ncbi:four helix bundle protein [Adhaeribacter swui]|uniref:Four helix bundle protein n=1 Tax=Adhaeribacter swui TaxID=2086471 RepID=A0A7G7G828_9BACT|nr:four helix bundle protein [Adhaeribacter swui]QNF33312.1 four helix bundle protein [Adhaeribacter swui]